jgi:hypothetical protein
MINDAGSPDRHAIREKVASIHYFTEDEFLETNMEGVSRYRGAPNKTLMQHDSLYFEDLRASVPY